MMQREVIVVDTVRTPQGRRGGGLSGMHPSEMLGAVQRELVVRAGIDPALVDQIVGGCISQSGAQSFNIARTAWLAAGLPQSVPATTVDAQCGSSQQALGLAASLIGSGVCEMAVACGVENMSMVPIGASTSAGPGRALTRAYFDRYEFISQFEAGERIAAKWGISRAMCDEFGLASQERAAAAWDRGFFDSEVLAMEAPTVDADGNATGETRVVDRDEGLRATSLTALGALKPVVRADGVHTAGNSSQIADQASAVLLASADAVRNHRLSARARIVDHCLVGVDPVLMLTGPIDTTNLLLERNGLAMSDLDVIEINEAFASVVLAWARELQPDMAKVNPNGGAIAIGHALGSTGTRLTGTAVNQLEAADGEWALVTMCCGGGLGTGTLLQRI